MRFKPNEFGCVVFLGEAQDEFLFVLADALGEVAGYAEIEHARLAGHEIDVEAALHEAGIFAQTQERFTGRNARDGAAVLAFVRNDGVYFYPWPAKAASFVPQVRAMRRCSDVRLE